MKKYFGIIILSILLIIGYLGLEYFERKAKIIDNWCFSDEQIKEYGPFWITVPSAENNGLAADVNGIMFENEPDIIYLVLPKTVNEKKLYIMSEMDMTLIMKQDGWLISKTETSKSQERL